MSDKRSLFRVNYYESGQPKSALIAALTEADAASFVGVEGNSGIQVIRDRYPIEVVGLDAGHDLIASSPVNIAPPPPTRSFTDAEMAKLRQLIAQGDVAGVVAEVEKD